MRREKRPLLDIGVIATYYDADGDYVRLTEDDEP